MNDTTKEHILASYEGNRVLRSLFQLIPYVGGALDVILTKTLDQIREERARAFFDELAEGKVVLNEDLLKSEDFLHAYFSTVKYALNSQRREKIRMFAHLLESSLMPDGPQSTDEYEDFLKILDELSYRELTALVTLDEYSSRFPKNELNELQWTETFWDAFAHQLTETNGIPSNEITDFMNRISRTGCYEIFPPIYNDYKGGKGQLTPIYQRLKKFIIRKNEEN
ncbi:MAG: hypothetical protein ACFUZC_20150 [Chthoniobacteraceae bacterium]